MCKSFVELVNYIGLVYLSSTYWCLPNIDNCLSPLYRSFVRVALHNESRFNEYRYKIKLGDRCSSIPSWNLIAEAELKFLISSYSFFFFPFLCFIKMFPSSRWDLNTNTASSFFCSFLNFISSEFSFFCCSTMPKLWSWIGCLQDNANTISWWAGDDTLCVYGQEL